MNTEIEGFKNRHADLVRIEAEIQGLVPALNVQETEKRELQARLAAALNAPGPALEVGAVVAGLEAGLAVVNRRWTAANEAYRKGEPLLIDQFHSIARQLAKDLQKMDEARHDAHRDEWLRVGRLHTPRLQEQDYHRHVQLHGGGIFYSWTNYIPSGGKDGFDIEARARFLAATGNRIAVLISEAAVGEEANPVAEAASATPAKPIAKAAPAGVLNQALQAVA